MEAAVAARVGHDMTLVVRTACAGGRAWRPDRVVDLGAEADSGAALLHCADVLADRARSVRHADEFPGVHQRALAKRTSADSTTSSTIPYATASSGAMNRSRSMSFITCSSG